MTAIFGNDRDRAQAIELRRLLIRLQNGEGEDPALGADIREAFALPHTIGDPVGCLDCALGLTTHLGGDMHEALHRAVVDLRERVRQGWKSPGQIVLPDVARAITAITLKCRIAQLEGTPV